MNNKNKPWRPFKEGYEIGEHQGRATVQRVESKGAHIFATFDSKQKAQEFLDDCPSRKVQELKNLISF